MEKNIFEKQSEESIYEEIIEEKSLPFFFRKNHQPNKLGRGSIYQKISAKETGRQKSSKKK